MQDTRDHREGLDTLRAVATLGVIIIHVSTPVVKMAYFSNFTYWWIGNLLDSAVRFAVPSFLLLSGATLLNKEYSLGEFYKKRFTRVLVPFLFWMVAYWVFRWISLDTAQQPKDFQSITKWAVTLFLNEGISKHFWYVYMILFIYLFVPFIGKVLRRLNNRTVLFVILAWIILTFVLRNMPINFYNWSNNFASKFFGYALFSGYLVVGFYLNRLDTTSKKTKWGAGIVCLLTVLIAAGVTSVASRNAHKLDMNIYGNLTLNTICQSIALFILLKDSAIKNKYTLWLQRAVSHYSYGIYLSHIMVIGIFFQNGIFWTMAHPLISLPVIILLTLCSSLTIVFLLHKLPYGKYIGG